MRMKRFGRGC